MPHEKPGWASTYRCLAPTPRPPRALADTDRRVGEGKPVAPSFLLACVLWQDVKLGWEQRLQQRQHSFPALQDAIDDVFNQRIGDVSGRGKLAADMREIWIMQPRFEKRSGVTPLGLVEQARFRAGFDFLRLRADVGEVEESLASWWQEFQQADDDRRDDLIAQAREEQRQRPKAAAAAPAPAAAKTAAPAARRAPKAAAGSAAAAAPAAEAEFPEAEAEDGASSARRRRRRKPTEGADGGEGGAAATDKGAARDTTDDASPY